MFNRDIHTPTPSTTGGYIRLPWENLWDTAREASLTAFNNAKAAHDRKYTHITFDAGDRVLLWSPPASKLDMAYTGPYVVSKRIGDLVYVLEGRSQPVHVRRLRRYYGPSAEDNGSAVVEQYLRTYGAEHREALNDTVAREGGALELEQEEIPTERPRDTAPNAEEDEDEPEELHGATLDIEEEDEDEPEEPRDAATSDTEEDPEPEGREVPTAPSAEVTARRKRGRHLHYRLVFADGTMGWYTRSQLFAYPNLLERLDRYDAEHPRPWKRKTGRR